MQLSVTEDRSLRDTATQVLCNTNVHLKEIDEVILKAKETVKLS